MQRSITCLVFLLGLAVSFAQVITFPNEISKATVRPPSGKQLPVGKALTEAGLVNEQAPPCTLVRYTGLTRTLCGSSGNSQIDYNMFIVDVTTKSCSDAFIGANDAAGQAAVIANCDGTPSTALPAQTITFGLHIWNGTVDTYIAPTFCVDAANTAGLATATGAVGVDRFTTAGVLMPSSTRAMRCYYWCTGLCRNNGSQPLEFWLATASNELSEGIYYDLKVTEVVVPIQPLALGTTLTADQSAFWFAIQNNTQFNNRNTFTNHQGFVGPDMFDHYWVDIGPFGATPGIFWAFTTPDTILRFSIDEVRAVVPTTGARQETFSPAGLAQWEISLNSGDVASGTWSAANGWTGGQVPAPVVARDDRCRANLCDGTPGNDCRRNCVINNFRGDTNSACNLDLLGCSVVLGRIFVAVRKPTSYTGISGWDYRVWARFVARTDRCLPTSRLRIPNSNGQVITGTLATARGAANVPTNDDYFMINYGQTGYGIPALTGATNPYLVLTLYGVNHGTANLEVTKGKEFRLGHDNTCGTPPQRLICSTLPATAAQNADVNPGKTPVQDWCRIVIRNCPSFCGTTCPRSFNTTCSDVPPFHQANARDSFRSLLFGPGLDYFATVYTTALDLPATTASDGNDNNLLSGRRATDYALRFDVFDESAVDIRNGKNAAGSTWYTETEESITRYTHITSVGEQLYNHYFITFTAEQATNPELFFEMEIYTNHEEEEVKVYFNPMSLAGEALATDVTQRKVVGQINANTATGTSMITDNCYSNTISCITSAKGENTVASAGVPAATNVCYMQWQACKIQPNIPYFFSVYGLSSSEIDNYDRPVDYTITWTVRTAQVITDHVTTGEAIVLRPAYQIPRPPIMYTHQYKLTIPANIVRLVERVRVRFADFKHDNALAANNFALTGYIQCGTPAGTCPCYTNVFNTQTAGINAIWNTWSARRTSWSDLVADACLCTSTTYYVAFSTSVGAFNNRPAMFTLTPYLEVVEITAEIQLSVNDKQANITTGRLVMDANRPTAHKPLTYLIRNPSTNPNDALEVLLRWVHVPGEATQRDQTEPAERVMLFVNRNAPPRLVNTQQVTSAQLSDDRCGVRCVADMQTPGTITSDPAAPQYQLFDDCSWCSIVLNECQWSPGDYLVRVWGNPTFDLGKAGGVPANNARTEPQLVVVDFTLYSRVYNKEPVALTANVPRHDVVREYHYNHYSFPTAGVPANSYVKAELYLERDQHDEIFFMWTLLSNTTTRAGFPFAPACTDTREYLDDYRCNNFNFNRLCKTSEATTDGFSNNRREYCSFYLQPCDVPPGATILLSVYAPGSRRRNFLLSNPTTGFGSNAVGNAWNSQHMWGHHIDYTVQMTVQAPIVLSLANGWPVTGSVFVGERVYYAFTATAAEFFGPQSAGSFLTFEVDAIRPQFSDCAADSSCFPGGKGENSRIKTMVISPESPAPGFPNCPCTNVQYLDEFEQRIFYCDLIPLPKTYYLEVLGLRTGNEAPYDPISFTVRAYKTDIPFTTLPVVPNTNQHPTDLGNICSRITPPNTTAVCPLTQSKPLNFGEWVAYKIDFTAGAGNDILYVEIMDVRALPTTVQAATLPEFNAYIQKDYAGSPPSFFRRGPQDSTTHALYTEFGSTDGRVFADKDGILATLPRTMLGNPLPNTFGCSIAECRGVAGTTAAFTANDPTPFCTLQLGGCISTGSGSFYLTVQSLVSRPYANCTDPAFTFKVRARSAPLDTASLRLFNGTRVGATASSAEFVTTTPSKVASGKTNQIHRYWMSTQSLTVPAGGYFMAWPTGNVNIYLAQNASVGNNNFGGAARTAFRTRGCVSECACPANLRDGGVPAGSKCFVNCGNTVVTSTFFIMAETDSNTNVEFQVNVQVGYPPTAVSTITQVPNSLFTGAADFPATRYSFLAGKVPPYSVAHWQLTPFALVSAGDVPTVTIQFVNKPANGRVCFTRGTQPEYISQFCTTCTDVNGDITLEYCNIANQNYFISVFNPSATDSSDFGVRLTYIRRAVAGGAPVTTSGSTAGSGVFTFTNPADWGRNGTAGFNEYAFTRFSVTQNRFAALRWRITVDSTRLNTGAAQGSITPQFFLMYGTNCLAGDGTCFANLGGTVCGTINNEPGTCYIEFPLCAVRTGDYILAMKIPGGFSNILATAAGAVTVTSTAAPPVSTLSVAQSPYSAYIASPSAYPSSGSSFGDVKRTTFYLHYAITVTANDIFGATGGTAGTNGLLSRVVSDRRFQVVLAGLVADPTKQLALFVNNGGLAGNEETTPPLGMAPAGTKCYTNTPAAFTCNLETVTVVAAPGVNTVLSGGGNTLTGAVAAVAANRRVVCSTSICQNGGLRDLFLRARNCFANTGTVDTTASTTFYASVTHAAGNAQEYIPPTNPSVFGVSAQIQELKKPVANFVAADLNNLYVILPTITPVAGPPSIVNTTVITPFTTSLDGSVAVGKTTLQVTIPAISTTTPQDARFAYFPINTAGFTEGDYLLINVTAPDWTGTLAFDDLTFDLWRADQCEPDAAAPISVNVNSVGAATHMRGHGIIVQTDPCHFAEGIQAGNNLWWLRVTNGGAAITQPFAIHVARMSPTRTRVDLTPTLPAATVPGTNYFEQTVVMWEERWVQYRICAPYSTRREQLYIQLQSHCATLKYWRNWQDFRWASAHCADSTGTLNVGQIFVDAAGAASAKEGMNTCRYTGGCYHISVKADDNSLANYFPTNSRLGGFRVGNPQVSFTLRAWLYTAPIEQLPLECTKLLYNLPASAPNAVRREIKCGDAVQLFYIDTEFENFGTSLLFLFSHTGTEPAAKPTATIIAPWYWRRVGVIGDALYTPPATLFTQNYVRTLYGSTWKPITNAATIPPGSIFADNANRDCPLPNAQAVADGVYRLEGAGFVWVNPCNFENGRYYITIEGIPSGLTDGNGQYRLTTKYDTKYIPVTTLSVQNNFFMRYVSAIGFSDALTTTNGVNYQYYKVVINRNTAQRLTVTIDNVGFYNFVAAGKVATINWYITHINEGRRHPGDLHFGSTAAADCSSWTGTATPTTAGTQVINLCGVIGRNDPASVEQFFIGLRATHNIGTFAGSLCTTGATFLSGMATYRLTIDARIAFTQMELDRTYCSGVAAPALFDTRWGVFNAFPIRPLTLSTRPTRHLYRVDVPSSLQLLTNLLRVEYRSLRKGTPDNERAIIVRIGADRVPNANLAPDATLDDGCFDFPAAGATAPNNGRATAGTSANGYPHKADHWRAVETTCGKWVNTYWVAVDLAPLDATNEALFTVRAYVDTCINTPTICSFTSRQITTELGKTVLQNTVLQTLTDSNFFTPATPGSLMTFTRTFSYADFFPPTANALEAAWEPKVRFEIAGVAGCGVSVSFGYRPAGSTACPTIVGTATDVATCNTITSFDLSTINNDFCVRGNDGAGVEFVALVSRRDPDYTCTAPATCNAGSLSTLTRCITNYGCDSAIYSYRVRMFLETPQIGCTVAALVPQNDFVKTWTEARLDRTLLPLASTEIIHYWTVPAGTEGFVHASIGLARGSTATATGLTVDRATHHNVNMKMFRGGCEITNCQTNTALTSCAGAAAGGTSEGSMSCYVLDHWRVDRAGRKNYDWALGNSAINRNISADAQYYLVVKPLQATHYLRNYISYSIRAQNAFTPLTATASPAITIHGFDRHYFKVAASEGGAPKSVVIRINVVHGPRLVVDAADTEFFVDQYANGKLTAGAGAVGRGQSTPLLTPDAHATTFGSTVATPTGGYRGWTRRQIAEHGESRIEISTRAMHPHSDWIYIWVSPEQEGTAAPCEKPTVYTIGATTGTANCGGAGAGTGFCTAAAAGSAVGVGGGNFWTYVNATAKHAEAQCRFNKIVSCYCPSPSAQCLAALTAFSCLESFHECDPDGFMVGMCRDQCSLVEELCGPWIPAAGAGTCGGCYPEYSCRCNDRYLDGPDSGATTCSGVIRPSSAVSPGVPPGSPVIPPTPVVPSISPGSFPAGPPGPPGPPGGSGGQGKSGPPGSGGADADLIVDVRVDLLNSAPSNRADVLLVICSLFLALFLML